MTGLPDSTKRVAKGYVVVSGPWVSSYENPAHAFEPRRSLGIPSREHCCPIVFSFVIIELLLMRIT